jgi:hypothetical protein
MACYAHIAIVLSERILVNLWWYQQLEYNLTVYSHFSEIRSKNNQNTPSENIHAFHKNSVEVSYLYPHGNLGRSSIPVPGYGLHQGFFCFDVLDHLVHAIYEYLIILVAMIYKMVMLARTIYNWLNFLMCRTSGSRCSVRRIQGLIVGPSTEC